MSPQPRTQTSRSSNSTKTNGLRSFSFHDDHSRQNEHISHLESNWPKVRAEISLFPAQSHVGKRCSVVGAIISPITSVSIIATSFGICWGKKWLHIVQKDAGKDVDLETEELKDYAKLARLGNRVQTGMSLSNE